MIVAIDPGVTTGVAWHVGGNFYADQFDEHAFYRWIDLHAADITHCQIEMFVINAATVRKTIVYDSLYLIGYLRYKAFQCNFPIGLSKPADVMASFLTQPSRGQRCTHRERDTPTMHRDTLRFTS